MKHRGSQKDRYWWMCYAATQNEGKGCSYWEVMDMVAEKRGPVVGVEHSSGAS
jgi:hypothetical protein